MQGLLDRGHHAQPLGHQHIPAIRLLFRQMEWGLRAKEGLDPLTENREVQRLPLVFKLTGCGKRQPSLRKNDILPALQLMLFVTQLTRSKWMATLSSRSPRSTALGGRKGRCKGRGAAGWTSSLPPGIGRSQPWPVLLPSGSEGPRSLPAAPSASFPAPFSLSLGSPEPYPVPAGAGSILSPGHTKEHC